jgi:hypothetical protein
MEYDELPVFAAWLRKQITDDQQIPGRLRIALLRIVSEHDPSEGLCPRCMHPRGPPYEDRHAPAWAPCTTLRTLAEAFADRPGWRDSWRSS